MHTGRERFTDFLGRKAMSRPALVLFLDAVAAVITGTPYAAMIRDPGVWPGALLKSAGLFGADGLVAGFDPVILAEALGAATSREGGRGLVTAPAAALRENFLDDPQLAAALETTRRLAAPATRDKACVAALTGPQTLARQVFGADRADAGMRALKPHLAAVAEALLKAKPDLLMFVEDLGPDSGLVSPGAARVYNTLRNLASYYNVPAALYLDGYEAATLDRALALKLDVYVLGVGLDGSDPDLATALELGAGPVAAGIGVRLEDAAGAAAAIAAATAACREGRRVLLTSLGPVAAGIDLQSARAMLANTLY